MSRYFLLIILVVSLSCSRKPRQEVLISDLMESNQSLFKDFIDHKEAYEIQVIYTQIDRDSLNNPHFTTYTFNADSSRYFYPASTVKLPLVLLSLEKIKALNIAGLNKWTPVFHDSVYSGQLSVTKDSTSPNGLPSLGHYMKKILVVSDNDAYNRLYEFMGQERTNARLNELGYSMRILHRLERPLSRDENRHTEKVTFRKGDTVIYEQPMLAGRLIEVKERVFRGKAFYRNDSLIQQPFEFTYKNFYSLFDQQRLLQSIVFPNSVPTSRRFNLSDEDRQFVLQYMSQLPDETVFPAYHTDTAYYDAYCKFFMYGDDRAPIPENIRIFNKVGDAYGYLIDNAYIVDFEKGIEFMLSAVINTNVDSVYNDEVYEYQRLGYPFFKELGKLIYNYEIQRERSRKPDLAEFRLRYDQPGKK